MNIFESLQADIINIREELNTFKEEQRVIEKKVRTAQHALVCATEEMGDLITKISLNQINPKKCRHEADRHHLRQGLGYSGFHCRKCATLVVKNTCWPSDPDEEGKSIYCFYPTHPFKFDCKHPKTKVLTCETARARTGRPVVKGHEIHPLSTSGKFCMVCGETWDEEK